MRQHDKTQHEILAIVTTWPFPLAKNTYTHVFIANGNGGVSVWPSIPNNTNIVKKSSKIHKLSLRLSRICNSNQHISNIQVQCIN